LEKTFVVSVYVELPLLQVWLPLLHSQ
jgi:hypothetical protein